MADTVTPARRSEIMAGIRGRDTQPELIVRRFLHAAGLRYRLHRRDLPGKPDVVFPSRKACLFIHGCFWHGCPRCVDGTRRVKSNTAFWTAKVEGNRARDAKHAEALRLAGWNVFTVWECELSDGKILTGLAEQITALEPKAQRSTQGAAGVGRE